MTAIDLNCDMGEGMSNDALLMPFISSANIACGFHAGDPIIMQKTVELAVEHGVKVGAHPSFLDRVKFGRQEMRIEEQDLYDLISRQLTILHAITSSLGVSLHHVKPHGALYNMSARDGRMAKTIAKAVRDFDPSLLLFGLSGSLSIREAGAIGLKTVSEVFADRSYQENGTLTPRSQKDALISDSHKSIEQVMQMVEKGTVTTVTGRTIPIVVETVCIHGDGKHAVEFAEAIHQQLQQNNIAVRAR